MGAAIALKYQNGAVVWGALKTSGDEESLVGGGVRGRRSKRASAADRSKAGRSELEGKLLLREEAAHGVLDPLSDRHDHRDDGRDRQGVCGER